MYRAEFFSYDVQYKDFAIFDDDTELSLDYIAWDASQIKIPGKRLAVIKGDLVHITRDGKTAFDGYVNNVSYPAKNVTQVDVLPLICCLRYTEEYVEGYAGIDLNIDVVSFLWTSVYRRLKLGQDNYNTETALYPYDEFLKIPSEFGASQPSAYRPFAGVKSESVISFLDHVKYALLVYRAAAKMRFEMSGTPKIRYDVDTITDEITLESDLDNVIERSVTLGNSYGNINKIIIYKHLEFTYGVAFYLHTDGTVDQNGETDRIAPVVSTKEFLQDTEDWDNKALQLAINKMQPKAFDNEIDLTYKADDALVRPSEIKIGTLATIWVDGVAYKSILTGKVLQNKLIKLIFGSVRVDLTKQILAERGRL